MIEREGIAMERNPIKQTVLIFFAWTTILLFKVAHNAQKLIHPGMAACIKWTRTWTIILANFRTKNFDGLIVLMHFNRELNERVSILRDGIRSTCHWIFPEIRLIAHIQEVNRVKGILLPRS